MCEAKPTQTSFEGVVQFQHSGDIYIYQSLLVMYTRYCEKCEAKPTQTSFEGVVQSQHGEGDASHFQRRHEGSTVCSVNTHSQALWYDDREEAEVCKSVNLLLQQNQWWVKQTSGVKSAWVMSHVQGSQQTPESSTKQMKIHVHTGHLLSWSMVMASM